MNLKPSDFFISITDFFSVILPGALVTYCLEGQFYSQFFGAGKVFPIPETGGQKWIVFLFATYIIGNILFVIGSALLDSRIYDRLLRKRFFYKNCDLSYLTATAIRDQYISSEAWISRLAESGKLTEEEKIRLLSRNKCEIINTYKWAQHFLAIKNPEALVDIKKFEADSKFFRSLVVAFAIIGVLLLGRSNG